MDRQRLLQTMRYAIERGSHMLALAGLSRWRIAWGTNKTQAVSIVYMARKIQVSRHFIPLVEPEALRSMLACAVFRVSGHITSWPTDTECIERISRALAPGIDRAVLHHCPCGFTTFSAHALQRQMLTVTCPRCSQAVEAFRCPRQQPALQSQLQCPASPSA
jgi:hypothetical protein